MKILFFETVKSKVIISLFETVRLSVSVSPRNLYNSLKSIKEIYLFSLPYPSLIRKEISLTVGLTNVLLASWPTGVSNRSTVKIRKIGTP